MAKKKSKSKAGNVNTKSIVVYKAPATVGTVSRRSAPKVNFDATGNCTITHTEYLADVTVPSTGNAAVYKYICNPQNSTTFTWLSAIATRFELFKFTKLKFQYKPSVSTATTGFVALGFDFDSYDSSPTKNEMLAWRASAKCAAWQECTLDVSTTAASSPFKYCDSLLINANSTPRGDKRMDALGNFYVMSNSFSAQIVGEVFVTYTVHMKEPSYKLPPSLFAQYYTPYTLATGTDLFVTTSSIPGNIRFQGISENALRIDTAGRFLLTIYTNSSGDGTGVPTATFSEATGYNTADWNSTLYKSLWTTTQSIAMYYLEILVPGVLITFAQFGGTAVVFNFLMSTWKDNSPSSTSFFVT